MANSKKKHGGNVWNASSEYGQKIEEILDYSANISPLGTPQKVKEAIIASLDKLVHYPDPDSLELRQELAGYLGIKRENIIVGNGSVELIYLLAKMVRPKKALLLHPTFSEYEFAVTSEGGAIKSLELLKENDFRLDKAAVIRALADVEMAFLCNPNNPTGCLTSREDVLAILEAAAQKNVLLIVDEAFLDFVQDGENISVIKEVEHYDNLFVLRSLTKFFALPGLRIGCGISNPKILEKINGLREPWTVNSLAQAAAIEALRDKEYSQKVKEIIWVEKEFLFEELRKIPGIYPYPPSVNYIFLNIRETGFTSTDIQQALAPRGILVRNCDTYPYLGENFLRVAVRTHAENIKLLAGLKAVLTKENN